jgi:hypothetical protein
MAQQLLVTVPNVTLTLDQLLAAIDQLDDQGRAEIARALMNRELDERLAALMSRLANKTQPDDLGGSVIAAEVRTVRENRP